jgi:cell division transport system permease protein
MSLRSAEFVIQETAVGIRRNPLMTVASISNVTVALCVFGAFLLASRNLSHMTTYAQSQARLTIFLKPKVEQAKTLEIETKVNADQRVKSCTYHTPEENLRRTLELLGVEDAFATLVKLNPLGGSFEVEPKQSADLPGLAQEFGKLEGVDEARYGREYVDKLYAFHRLLRVIGVTATTALAVATLLVIFSTIRLTVFARRREIRVMQLVGATDWLIRAPFMLEGIFYGLVGAGVACALLVSGYGAVTSYVSANLQFIPILHGAGLLVGFCATVLLTGVTFGLVGAYAALRRFLRLV